MKFISTLLIVSFFVAYCSALTCQYTGSGTIQVAVNQWGGSGDTGYFPINGGQSESWTRSDQKPFVMAVKRSSGPETYYAVTYESVVTVTATDVTIVEMGWTGGPYSGTTCSKYAFKIRPPFESFAAASDIDQEFTAEELAMIE
ncbi:hypothetical protein SAMD00019534_021130 [Acytostelium subglobosum LB1]|uniref:hypothetical protein n=1 Tax=Acytostelium subglobosum LB1 TaxID=1410327 RepID=UPI000644A119|nr:hypothetical protein SAMD00019534_021130 [Acytostelium subglobosum LB1]GAM18938.1 hypothetical protein SAMD00019534_021130 [Acytostelium subglobosum LB1]|eukprot:XP_012758158.1 hypothetical protein SAMD00019534_021130 [Acytostelium subglobosum LB1]